LQTIRAFDQAPLTNQKSFWRTFGATGVNRGKSGMNREIVLQNVRRYRATASLYRQTAAFRPLQRWSLLEQAEEWEQRAVAELEGYFQLCDHQAGALRPQVSSRSGLSWEMRAAA
jgi:hypothetical protein